MQQVNQSKGKAVYTPFNEATSSYALKKASFEFFDCSGKTINRFLLDKHMNNNLTLSYASKGFDYHYMYMLNPHYSSVDMCNYLLEYVNACNGSTNMDMFIKMAVKDLSITNYIDKYNRILEEYYKFHTILEQLITHRTKFNFFQVTELGFGDIREFTEVKAKFSLT